MAGIPDPEAGLVIHFDYLWKREQAQGRDNARYARPCTIVLAHRRSAADALIVLVAPITHLEPTADTVAVEMPAAVKAHLRLDDERSWIVTGEVNEFVWPGFDLQPNAAGEIAYGVIPDRLFQKVKASVLEQIRLRRLARLRR